MKKRNLWMSMCMLIWVFISCISTFAESSNQIAENYQTALAYAMKVAPEHIETVLGAKQLQNNSCNEQIEFYIGDGYHIYYEQNGTVESNIIEFPIFQNGQIVLTLDVECIANEWFSNSSYDNTSLLNSVNDIYNVQLIYDVNDCPHLQNGYSGIYGQNRYLLGLFASPEHQASARGNGFYVNNNNYKYLNMDYCLCLQKDTTGRDRGLCWAAAAATTIRYVTGNRSIEAHMIADEMGINYDTGGTISDIRTAMINHGCSVQYKSLSRPARSITEVYHNINNQYPIVIGTEGSLLFLSFGHAVTIVGYNGNTLIYWNSATGAIGTTIYNGTTAYIKQGGVNYQWLSSVLIPL